MLELAAESGCTLLSIGFESISRSTLTSVHKHVNRPETFAALVEKVHSYGIMVFGLFMYGFDGDDLSVFDQTVDFNIDSKYDACAYSTLTPYPGTLTWYEMKKANRIVSFDWTMYDQGHVVYRPAKMSGDELRIGVGRAYGNFYATIFDCQAISHERQTPSRAMGHLQSDDAERLEDREHSIDRGADGGTRNGADAAHFADQAGVARSRARGGRRSGPAPELTQIDPSSIPCSQFYGREKFLAGFEIRAENAEHAARHHCHVGPVNAARRHALVRAFDDDGDA